MFRENTSQMKKLNILFILFLFSIAANAQTGTKGIICSNIHYKTTEIAPENFIITEAVTTYDLALNLSYLHHISQNLKSDYLTLPIVIKDGSPMGEKSLKELRMSDVLKYQFTSGGITMAIYGARAKYGILNLYLKE
jgi:hypothetical protein